VLFSWISLGVLIGVLVAVIVGLHLTQRWFPSHLREKHNDVAGTFFAGLAVLYSVLLAFVIISLWSGDNNARQTTYSEASDLGAVYWLARNMPLNPGVSLEHLTLEYAHTVINQEWPLMVRHQSSPAATQLVYEMRDEAFGWTPVTLRDQVLYQEVTGSVTALAADRRARLDAIGSGVPSVLWSALIVGGVITIGFSFLFGVSSTWAHIVMTGAVAAVIVICLILISELNYPFAGPARVSPEAFQVFLARLPPPR
jgi:hypothetical protein